MQVVIDIDDKLYEIIKNPKKLDTMYHASRCAEAVRNGTPLPKGHGRLIDADAFITTLEDASKKQNYKELLFGDFLTVNDVFEAIIGSLQNEGLAEGDAPTIIEAESEDKE